MNMSTYCFNKMDQTKDKKLQLFYLGGVLADYASHTGSQFVNAISERILKETQGYAIRKLKTNHKEE